MLETRARLHLFKKRGKDHLATHPTSRTVHLKGVIRLVPHCDTLTSVLLADLAPGSDFSVR